MAEIIDGKPSMGKFWIAPICGLVALGALSYAGYRAYAHWEPEHLVNQARQSFEKKDYTAAGIQMRRALQINPGSVSATRYAAEILEAEGSTNAVIFREHVLDLAPNGVTDKLAWLSAAIRFREPEQVRKAIASFTAAEKKSAAFESREGNLAASLGKYDEAAQHYLEAQKYDSKDVSLRFNYADMLLHSDNLDLHQAGIDAMKQMTSDSTYSTSAHRELIRTLIAQGDLEQALAESQPFQGTPAAEFEDRLAHLDILDRLVKPEAFQYYAILETEAAKTPRDAGLFISWLYGRGRARAATEWAQGLPKSITSTPECGAPLAECYMKLADWKSLKDATTGTDWKQFEFLRLALLARASKEIGDDDNGVETTWHAAVTAATDNKAKLDELRRLFAEWGPDWNGSLNDVLLALGSKWGDTKALAILYGKYAKARDTQQLCEITRLMVADDPSNRNAANNFAMLSMLCKKNLPDALKIAHDLYDTDSANPAYVSTYAYGLHLQGYSGQGLKAIEKLAPEELKKPSIAVYYGILLAANKKPAKAIEFLLIAKGDDSLLPEEKELVETALDQAKTKQSDGKTGVAN